MNAMSVHRRAALAVVAMAVEGSWRAPGPLQVPRLQATVTLLDSGKVLRRRCGQNCGKVLLVGDNAAGAAALYTPASSFAGTTTVTGTVANVVVPAGSITVQPGGSPVINAGTGSSGASPARAPRASASVARR